MTQDFLTNLFNIAAISFIAFFAFQFITGFQPTTRPAATISGAQNDTPITVNPTPEAENTGAQIATLEWLIQQIPQVDEELVEEVNIIELAKSRMKAIATQLDITALKLYKLRGETVVRLRDIPSSIPDTIKRYKLRGEDVVKLKSLEQLQLV